MLPPLPNWRIHPELVKAFFLAVMAQSLASVSVAESARFLP